MKQETADKCEKAYKLNMSVKNTTKVLRDLKLGSATYYRWIKDNKKAIAILHAVKPKMSEDPVQNKVPIDLPKSVVRPSLFERVLNSNLTDNDKVSLLMFVYKL